MDQTSSLSTEALYIFILLFVATVLPTELVLCVNQGNILPKTCTNADTFRVTFGQSFGACVEECQRRQRCKIVMYKHGINECSLKDFINITALKEEEPICLFTNLNEWERNGLSPCDKNSCGLSEICVKSNTNANGFECVTSECPKPQAVDHASVYSNTHGIGKRNGYKCDPTFVGKGNPFITCQDDGNWTSTNFSCLRIGRKPTFDLKNAYIISVDGEKWIEGTHITYACRDGYQGRGINESSVINSNGKWWPRVVRCCNENITHWHRIWKDSCIATFNGSIASTFEDMENHCTALGGRMKNITPDISTSVFKNEGYQWLLSGMTKHNFRKYLDRCIFISDIIQNISSYTDKDLKEEVISRNLTKSWKCETAKWWAPNEPSGGEGKDCVRFNSSTNLMYDAECSGRPDTGFICSYPLPEI